MNKKKLLVQTEKQIDNLESALENLQTVLDLAGNHSQAGIYAQEAISQITLTKQNLEIFYDELEQSLSNDLSR